MNTNSNVCLCCLLVVSQARLDVFTRNICTLPGYLSQSDGRKSLKTEHFRDLCPSPLGTVGSIFFYGLNINLNSSKCIECIVHSQIVAKYLQKIFPNLHNSLPRARASKLCHTVFQMVSHNVQEPVDTSYLSSCSFSPSYSCHSTGQGPVVLYCTVTVLYCTDYCDNAH